MAHELLREGDEVPAGGRLDFMAKVMHTLGRVEPRYESTVVATARIDGVPDLDALRERARAELLPFWPLRSVLETPPSGGAARWRELTEADMRARIVTQLVTTRLLASRHDFDGFVGDSFALPWDWAAPLWRIELVTFADAPQQSALFVRLNHCIADGVAMLKMFLCLFDGGKANAVDPPRRRPTARAPASAGARDRTARRSSPLEPALACLPRVLRAPMAVPLGVARRFWIAVNGFAYAALLPALPGDSRTALKLPSCAGHPGLSGRRIAGTAARVPFEALHEVKEAFGCTVNDVLVACVAGAVRQYLIEATGEREAQASRAERGPRLVRALLPANLRADGSDALRALGNEWTLLGVALPVEHATPDARLREAIRRCDELKLSPELAVTLALNKLGVTLLPARVFADTTFKTMDKFSVLLSNVAGPRAPVTLLGSAVPHLAFFATSLVSTCFDVLSYAGGVYFTVLADPAVLPRGAEPLLRAVTDELDALVHAARAPARPPPFDALAWRRLVALVAVAGVLACAIRFNCLPRT